MRRLFQAYFSEHLSEFEFFEPEFAMKYFFSEAGEEPFDLADFEQLVGELSHSIVIFPEAAGSFAETGYFSAVPELAIKTILVLDATRSAQDSFILLGPAKKIAEATLFHPNIEINYRDPDFDQIAGRIRRYPVSRKKKAFDILSFSRMTSFSLFGLIRELVSLMTIATLEDLMFMSRSIFSGNISINRIRQITSILVGSGHMREIGDFAHFAVSKRSKPILTIRDGAKNDRDEIRLTLAAMYSDADPDFLAIVADARNAD